MEVMVQPQASARAPVPAVDVIQRDRATLRALSGPRNLTTGGLSPGPHDLKEDWPKRAAATIKRQGEWD